MATKLDLEIVKGDTFEYTVFPELPTVVYKPITAIMQTAPVRITAATHGMVNGQKGAVTNVKGMVEINAEANNVKESDRRPVTVIDANTVEFNGVNAAGFKAYVSGGILQYNTPMDLTGYTARMSICDKLGGTELLRLDMVNGRIVVNPSAKTITLSISATDTAALTFSKGVYDLEIISPSGVVTKLLNGAVTVSKEATTT